MKNKLITIVAIMVAALAVAIPANAQAKRAVREDAASRILSLVSAAKEGRSRVDPEMAATVRADFADAEQLDGESPFHTQSITGTWNVHIPVSTGGAPPFDALQTFGSDGTFVEASSLFGMGGEGPAHGVYERSRRGYVLTFELFVFDPATGESVGRVRVRCSIRMSSSNTFSALSSVDFIEPNGTVIEDIDGGPFSGSRLIVRGL